MRKKSIAIVPGSPAFENNELFNKNNKYNFDDRLMPYFLLKRELSKNNIEINTIDLVNDYSELDLVFFQTLNYEYIYKCIKYDLENKLVYIAVEPPVVEIANSKSNLKKIEDIFQCILTWRDDIVDGDKYLKYFFPQYFQENPTFKGEFNQKKLLVNISGAKLSKHPKELYSKRLEVINYFEKNHSEDFDFYGRGWDEYIRRNKYKNYKGEVKSKFKIYSKYKFALCFENMKHVKGYITEKIFDCFKARIIPIYWGADNVTEYIPEGCFIDYRQFIDVDELYNYISNMSEKEYNNYIININKYLYSKDICQFTEENLINTFSYVIKKSESTDKSSINRINIKNKLKIMKNYYFKLLKKNLKGLLINND
ncbi:Glycosyltransferase family 10 (fucosyltransferase) C-term [Orenia metallireducens]|uniref:Glycosyltransferase family 10 (Fucosyltransferase) C-term n=1 Tax=Orenia metallireducens TaxID=1413210 RepID=A0A285FWU6_9FIRM|nr:glycosyltransferase family 10 [Orenia metallireducens]SNY15294.1 Glycosyltransferase family 10 (fucosyltransferase) C-term [Orenia metallireducens]